MLKHYIRWYFPGSFTSETADKPLERPIIKPRRAYAYQVYAQTELIHSGELLKGEKKLLGPMTYFGTEFTKEDVMRCPGNMEILISNMEDNHWTRVVQTSAGQFFPLEDGDIVLCEPKP